MRVRVLLLLLTGAIGCGRDADASAWRAPDAGGAQVESTQVALGRRLFYEQRLSLDGRTSCATCHEQDKAFAVHDAQSRGAAGKPTARNAPSLANVAYASYLTWSNLTFDSLEQQMLTPLFGDNPVEMGAGTVAGDDNHYSTGRLRQLVQEDSAYEAAFRAAFPAVQAPKWSHAIDAIASFERTLQSFGAPYDAYLRGEPDALDPAAERGRALFFSERLRCGECHCGPLLSLAFPVDSARPTRTEAFRNNGLYNLEQGTVAYLSGEVSRYPLPSVGIAEFTLDVADDGKFRIPSLRNVSVTAPYMHDGSMQTLSEVLDHYARGGRRIDTGPLRGDGRDHPAKDPLISGFTLGEDERAELLAFLDALTDRDFLTAAAYAAP